MTGCQDNVFQNGDLDFDGTPYWTEWPTGTVPNKYPSTFVEQFPTTGGTQYSKYFFQTDIALSESACLGNTLPGGGGTSSGCTVPPQGPGNCYPYWSTVHAGNYCALEFGNVSSAPFLTNNGKDAEYGQDQFSTLGYPEFEGATHNNTCRTRTSSELTGVSAGAQPSDRWRPSTLFRWRAAFDAISSALREHAIFTRKLVEPTAIANGKVKRAKGGFEYREAPSLG